MNKTELLAKLEAIDAQGLNVSVSVKEMIQLVNQIEIDFNPELALETIEMLSDEIADEIWDEGIDVIDDFELGLNRNEVYIESIDLSRGTLSRIASRVLSRIQAERQS